MAKGFVPFKKGGGKGGNTSKGGGKPSGNPFGKGGALAKNKSRKGR